MTRQLERANRACRFAPRRCFAALLGCTALSGLTGCAGDGDLDARRGTVRVIQNAEPAEVLAAAESILRREFGRVEIDRTWSQIRAQPQEYTAGAEPTDLGRGRSTLRRSALLTTSKRENGTLVRLRVDLERQDTRRHEATPGENYRLTDTPGYSPIERDAATTAAQNTVWTPIGRSVALEMSLLSDLQEIFATRTVTEPAPADQGAQP